MGEKDQEIHDSVKQYYGQTLTSNQDLKTNACCTADAMPSHLRKILADIHPEIQDKFYGCGSPIPPQLTDKRILDLGCGTGRDCYLLSKLVGQNGSVIGVDMTKEQLDVAIRHQDYHREKFGFNKSNVTFKLGRIENLKDLSIADNSLDAVISNCVINLSPNKDQVFSEIFRVLKPGGELYFSDVFSTRRIPKALAVDPILLGECLGGAMYIEDFRRALANLGYLDYRVVSQSTLSVEDTDVYAKLKNYNFLSLTVRVFKLPLEDKREDYGHSAVYLGNHRGDPNNFLLDEQFNFPKGDKIPICGNTAVILRESRYATSFEVTGDRSNHYGLYPHQIDNNTAVEKKPLRLLQLNQTIPRWAENTKEGTKS